MLIISSLMNVNEKLRGTEMLPFTLTVRSIMLY
jgi:hypothetical protein